MDIKQENFSHFYPIFGQSVENNSTVVSASKLACIPRCVKRVSQNLQLSSTTTFSLISSYSSAELDIFLEFAEHTDVQTQFAASTILKIALLFSLSLLLLLLY